MKSRTAKEDVIYEIGKRDARQETAKEVTKHVVCA